MQSTNAKRIIILTIFTLSLAAFGLVLYLVFSPAATCTDGKKNQGEKAVDCGGPCSPCKEVAQTKDIETKETAFALGGNGTYDVVAKISNPNDTVGGSSFDYVFTLKDQTGKVIASKEGTSFVLPADSKYVAELGIQTADNAVPAKVEFAISNVKWEKLGDIEKPRLSVYGKKFSSAPMGEGSDVEGILKNDSAYDLNKISLVIILRDENAKVMGVNKTEKNAVRSGEQRDFRLTWPYELKGDVRAVEVDAQSDVFDPQGFSATAYDGR